MQDFFMANLRFLALTFFLKKMSPPSLPLAAVFLDVTQCSPALRDISKNGCEGDYPPDYFKMCSLLCVALKLRCRHRNVSLFAMRCFMKPFCLSNKLESFPFNGCS